MTRFAEGQIPMRSLYCLLTFFIVLQPHGAAATQTMSRAPEILACAREEIALALCEKPVVPVVSASKKPKDIASTVPFDASAPCPLNPPFFMPAERAKDVLPECRDFVAAQPAESVELASALGKLGLIEFSAGDSARARLTLHRALAIDPDNLTALLAKITMLEIVGEALSARPDIERLKSLYPDEPRVRASYARLMVKMGEPEQGLAAIDSALELLPDDTDLHHRRADILLRLGRDDEALATLDLIIDIWPGDGRAYFKRAELELTEGRAARALADAEKAKQHHFQTDEVNILVLQAQLMLGNLDEALDAVTEAEATFFPQYETPILTLYRVSILNRLGRKEEAEDALKGLRSERNEHILKLQVFMRNMGYADVPISGSFDEATERGLSACLLKGGCSTTMFRAI